LVKALLTYVGTTPSQDILEYWKSKQHTFPGLAAMARDVLAVPATGVGVERLFNMARDICHYRRSHLKPESIRGSMMVKMFDKIELEDELVALAESEEDNPFGVIDDEEVQNEPLIQYISDDSEHDENDYELVDVSYMQDDNITRSNQSRLSRPHGASGPRQKRTINPRDLYEMEDEDIDLDGGGSDSGRLGPVKATQRIPPRTYGRKSTSKDQGTTNGMASSPKGSTKMASTTPLFPRGTAVSKRKAMDILNGHLDSRTRIDGDESS